VVLVTGELVNPSGADTLLVADRIADLASAADFSEIHDIVAETAEDAGKLEAWKEAGYLIRTGSRAGRS